MKEKLKVVNLSHRFSNQSHWAIRNLTWEFAPNKITAVIGPSASGKTVLLKHLNGLLIPTEGQVIINDYVIQAKQKKLKNINQIRKEIGFVFQFAGKQLFEETVGKDIMFGPLNFGLTKEVAQKNAMKYFDILGLKANFWNRSPFQLSGGEKRKVAITGIFAYEPTFILFDQLGGGLDNQVKHNLFKLLFNLKTTFRKTIIFTSNNNDDVLELADSVVVLNEGKIVRSGTPMEILSDQKFCQELQLLMPKTIRFAMKLKKIGIDIKKINYHSETELINSLVKYFKIKASGEGHY